MAINQTSIACLFEKDAKTKVHKMSQRNILSKNRFKDYTQKHITIPHTHVHMRAHNTHSCYGLTHGLQDKLVLSDSQRRLDTNGQL